MAESIHRQRIARQARDDGDFSPFSVVHASWVL
jgi:hypothetical protein